MNDLGNKYALAALKDKRATLAGEVALLKKQIAAKTDQLAHVDATIKVFDPSYDGMSIRPKRVRQRVRLFKQGELGRLILDALRRAGKPVTAPEIVTAVLAAQGHGEDSRRALAPRIRGNLAYLQGRKIVTKEGNGTGATWVLTQNA